MEDMYGLGDIPPKKAILHIMKAVNDPQMDANWYALCDAMYLNLLVLTYLSHSSIVRGKQTLYTDISTHVAHVAWECGVHISSQFSPKKNWELGTLEY